MLRLSTQSVEFKNERDRINMIPEDDLSSSGSSSSSSDDEPDCLYVKRFKVHTDDFILRAEQRFKELVFERFEYAENKLAKTKKNVKEIPLFFGVVYKRTQKRIPHAKITTRNKKENDMVHMYYSHPMKIYIIDGYSEDANNMAIYYSDLINQRPAILKELLSEIQSKTKFEIHSNIFLVKTSYSDIKNKIEYSVDVN